MMGGTQDNNSIRTIGGNTLNWTAVLGGDGMYCAINQQNNNIAYAEYQWGNLYRSYDAQSSWPSFDYISWAMESDRKNWSAPLVLTPENDQVAYFGTHRVWKSTNDGSNWTAMSGDLTDGGNSSFNTLTTLAVSSLNENYVLAGSADGNVHISLTSGFTWDMISMDLPDRWITRVAFDPIEEETIYITISGFRWDEPLPHVFKSNDLGGNWTDISGNLPEIPVNTIVINPMDNDNIFVGTDAGIYISRNGGDSWENASGNMPQTAVVALRINPLTNIMYTATYGNSIFKIDLDELYVGHTEHELINNSFTASLTNTKTSRFIIIENHEPQSFRIEVYSLSGKKIDSFTTALIQKEKYKIDINKYSTINNGILLFNVIGNTKRKTLKATF